MEARGFWEELRRWPAFCMVFWRVRSDAVAGRTAGVGEVEMACSFEKVLEGMMGRDGGD